MPILKSSATSLFLAFLVAHPGAQGATFRQKHEFIEHMKRSEKRNGPIRMSKPSLAKFLNKAEQVRNLKGSSDEPKVSKEELQKQFEYYHNYQQFAQDKRDAMAAKSAGDSTAEEGTDRKLYYNQNNQYGNGNGNGNYRNNNGGYNGNGNAQRNYNNGNGGNYNAAAQNQGQAQGQGNGWSWWWKNNDIDNANYTEAWQMYENDNNQTYSLNNLADLSLKYAGCSSVTSYVGVEDGDEDSSGFAATSLVQYRFCPAESCDDNSWNGCTSEYGEYMMSIQDFLQVQVEFKEEQYQMLCDYCQGCTEYNDGAYCDGDNCCTHTDDCEEYRETCEGEDEELEGFDIDGLFECTEVEVSDEQRRKLNWYNGQQGYGQNRNWWNGNGNNNNYNNYNNNNQNNQYGYGDGDDEGDSVAYIGLHCNGQNMQVGLFSDNACTHLLATEDNINVTEMTGVNLDTQNIEEYFVPQGCLTCGGEEYNDKNQWWYIEADKDEQNDEDMIYEVCNNMYEASAKCNANLADDIKEQLYESDAQMEGEQATCDFIKDAILGEIDENGFVYSHEQQQNRQSALSRFWKYMTDPAAQDPSYNGQFYQGQGAQGGSYGQGQYMQGRYSNLPSAQQQAAQREFRRHRRVSPGQKVALTFGAVGTVVMGAAAHFLQKEYEAATPDGLMRNENAESSLPYDNDEFEPASRPAPVQTPSRARLVD